MTTKGIITCTHWCVTLTSPTLKLLHTQRADRNSYTAIETFTRRCVTLTQCIVVCNSYTAAERRCVKVLQQLQLCVKVSDAESNGFSVASIARKNQNIEQQQR